MAIHSPIIRRYFLASLAALAVAVAFVLIDGFIAEATGLFMPGKMSAALAFFAAFFVGGRIGGRGYFWIGIALFLAIQIFSLGMILYATQNIQLAAGVTPDATLASIAIENRLSSVMSLLACVAGLKLGARGQSK